MAGFETREALTGEFPMRLKWLRERRGISRKVLADLCLCSKSALSRYERGERVPDIEVAARLADFFDVSVDKLLGTEKRRPWR